MNEMKWKLVPPALLLAAAAAGCASQSAPGVKGNWKPVNRFADTTEAIPIDPPHFFYATPADATLKALLGRWAKNSNKTLSYRHPNDFTVYAPLANIRTPDLQKALTALNEAYASQRVSIVLDRETIVVSDLPSTDTPDP